MNSIYIVVRYAEDSDTIEEIISAHPNRQLAINGERFYRQYKAEPHSGVVTNVLEVDFEAG
jgi:hypothetical protein